MACAIATVGVVAAAVVVVVAAGIDCRMVIVIIIVGCQELQCPDAVTADGGEEAVGIGPFGDNLLGNPFAPGVRVRQSVVAHGPAFRTTIGVHPAGQG